MTLLLLVLGAMLPAIIILVRQNMQEQRREVARAQGMAMRQVLHLAEQEEHFARASHQLLSALAALPAIQKQDPKASSSLFADLLARNPQYANILSADKDGLLIASGVPTTGSISLADRKHFKDAIQTRRFATGGFIVSRTTNHLVFPFSLPTLDAQGQPTGVLIAVQDLATFDRIFQLMNLPKDFDLVVTDHMGVVVYQIGSPHSKLGQMLSASELAPLMKPEPQGLYRAPDPDGIPHLYAHQALSLEGTKAPYMFFRIGIPERVALAESRQAFARNMFALGLAFLGAMILAWILGGILVQRPVRRLLKATSELAEGDWSAAARLPRSKSEIGELAIALNGLGLALQKREMTLRSQELMMRTLFDAVNDAILVYDVENQTILWANQRMGEMYGYTLEEIHHLPKEAFHGEEPPYTVSEAFEWMRKVLKGKPQVFEWKARHSSGRLFWVECNLNLVRMDGKDCVLAVIRDIQKRKDGEEEKQRLERQIQQAQKLESLGILAGGIAHDFNNLLTALLGNLNLAMEHATQDGPQKTFMERAESVAYRAADLTKQMLTYAGRGRADTKPLQLNQVVQEMANLLIVSVPKKTALRLQLGEDLPLIKGDSAQIQQIVMNLVTNASEAIGDNIEGEIHLSTSSLELHEDTIINILPGQPIEPGIYVVLEVRDTGCGITPEQEAQIFDPFYSTKSSGRGLGLSAMLGILRNHRGGIRVQSEVGKGAIFSVYFPATTQKPFLDGEAEAMEDTKPLKGHVLLVEDEAAIRESTCLALEKRGLVVSVAEDGQAALEQFQKQPSAYDLVIMDLTMPRMNGRDAFRAIRAVRADIPIILCSGYDEASCTRELLDEGLNAFVPKPYVMKDLSATIRSCLA